MISQRSVLSALALVLCLAASSFAQRSDYKRPPLQAVSIPSPKSVLGRGYSITTHKKSGAIIRSAKQAKVGERLTTRFADGTVESTVEDQKQLPLFD